MTVVLRLYILGRNLLSIVGRRTSLMYLTGAEYHLPRNTLRFKLAFNNHPHKMIINEPMLFASSRHQAGNGRADA